RSSTPAAQKGASRGASFADRVFSAARKLEAGVEAVVDRIAGARTASTGFDRAAAAAGAVKSESWPREVATGQASVTGSAAQAAAYGARGPRRIALARASRSATTAPCQRKAASAQPTLAQSGFGNAAARSLIVSLLRARLRAGGSGRAPARKSS